MWADVVICDDLCSQQQSSSPAQLFNILIAGSGLARKQWRSLVKVVLKLWVEISVANSSVRKVAIGCPFKKNVYNKLYLN